MASTRGQIYKCNVCGIVTAVLESGAGEPVCCGQPMELQQPRSEPPRADTHLPVVRVDGDAVVVTVGRQPHPMEPKHAIAWIELIAGPTSLRRFLAPGDRPEVRFRLDGPVPTTVSARQFCNLHGLWQVEARLQ